MWEFPRTRYADCNGSEASEETEIAVNIGGVKHILYGDVLNRYPETRLAELVNRATGSTQDDLCALCDDYDDSKQEFYFDRDPEAFKCILELYCYGKIHMKRGICPMRFTREMDYWGIDAEYLDECCICSLNEVQTELAEIAEKVKTILDDLEDDATVTRGQRCQAFLWNLMEKPESSLAARVIAVVSFAFILLSSVVMCVGTIPELQVKDAKGNLVEHTTLESIDTACIIWFTVEYVLRLVSSSNKLRFVFSFMNIVDFLAIMPFYVVLILGAAQMELANVQQAVQALRILRIARIFKLARNSSGLQTLAVALKISLKELILMFTCMSVGIFLFSALGYTVEQSHPETMFTSIPQSFWWAITVMSTVGYGDIYPKTTLGRCNAAASVLCGIVAIALPVHLIINNFVIVYSKQRVLETTAKHEIELMALRAKEEEQECPEAAKMPSQASVDCSSVWDSTGATAQQSDRYIPYY
ncbi:potassium voltage-gated channel subfamily F member 1-like [Sinocyclocheilus rhinocerous]|uniref:potassium voltage-gated channel subfamily F member 1-like n=1 Tax=Sinocyclocheilus rhinocerous TaxID=307959 RepID=UPI0007B98B41|nr:PREDICTED: potassium voltage-gated channel subfamily F member 1-like [Sinocyclocheilus rhinocerous]